MILLLTDSDAFAGTERHMLDLASGLRAIGTKVTIGCPRPSPLATGAEKLAIPVIDVPKRGAVDIRAARQLAALLRSGEVELIHAHNGRAALHAAMAKSMAGTGRVVMTQHFLRPAHVDRKGPKAVVSHALHSWMRKRLDHVIAISDAVGREAVHRGDVHRDSITVVHNGLTPPSPAETAAAVRLSLGIPSDSVFAFCAARLETEKDVPLLLKAMTTVHPSVTCIVAGDGKLRHDLEAQIGREGLSGRMRLLGFRQDIPNLMAACDLFILPSRAEPFGLVLLEAMASGKAVIAANSGGPPEIVQHGETGLLFEPGNASSLTEAINAMATDPARRATAGLAGRARYERDFTTGRMVEGIMNVYGGVTKSAVSAKWVAAL